MILVDTSVWVDFFRASDSIMTVLKVEMRNQKIVTVECVFGELLQGAKNSREREIISAYWQNLPKRDESGLWIEAGSISSENKYFTKGIGLIDAFLIAFAKRYQSQIWSFDKKLLSVLTPKEKYSQPV